MNRDEVPEVRSKVRRATAPSALTCAVNSCECGLRAETSSSHASARLSSSRRCSSGRSDSMETGAREPRRCVADRKSTRLNSSHVAISYAVFCLKKKNKQTNETMKEARDID